MYSSSGWLLYCNKLFICLILTQFDCCPLPATHWMWQTIKSKTFSLNAQCSEAIVYWIIKVFDTISSHQCCPFEVGFDNILKFHRFNELDTKTLISDLWGVYQMRKNTGLFNSILVYNLKFFQAHTKRIRYIE